MSASSSTLFGVNAQVDLGNFAVGVGTLVVAAVSFYSIWRQSNTNISNFRKEWVENLRLHLAEFHSLQARLSILGSRYRRAREKENKVEEKEFFEKFMILAERSHYLKSYIKMMLNSKENGHSVLERCVEDAHRRSLMSAKEKNEEVDGGGDLPSLLDQARFVLKYEWERLKRGS